MTQREKFDALQNRLSTLLAKCEDTRIKTCRAGAAYYHAGVLVGIAARTALDALRLLRNEVRQQYPSITETDFDEFMVMVEETARDKDIPAKLIFKSLIMAATVVCEQAEASHWNANFTMVKHESGMYTKEF